MARLAAVRARIAAAALAAGRAPTSVRLVAVTKGVPAAIVQHILDAGQLDLGENRARELVEKASQVTGPLAAPGHHDRVVWHFIGRLQRNKVPALSALVSRWHSVDGESLGAAIAHLAPGATICVQVNVDRDPAKAGCAPADTARLVDHLRSLGLVVDGLMTVPTLGGDPRPAFATLAALAASLGLTELSMGMSADLEAAIAEGSTMVRVGRALFGPP